MLLSDFDFALPANLIAQQPLSARDASRLLIINRAQRNWRDDNFPSLPNYLNAGDVVVINNTRVFPARLIGTKLDTAARIELFLVRPVDSSDGKNLWMTLARPAKRLPVGARLSFGAGRLQAEIIEAANDSGERLVCFETTENFSELLEQIGRTPLPPYIKRDAAAAASPAELDRTRYQTVYARPSPDGSGAIAAPTAGLHFTPAVFQHIKSRAVEVAEITLHVGYGTFAPVRTNDLTQHKVAPERFSISANAAQIINRARADGKRIVAVGTTTARALESAMKEEAIRNTDFNESGFESSKPVLRATAGEADLTITPGYDFKIVDALLTNFHLPQSSLLILVAAFAGRDLTLAAYKHAVTQKYRFYSYGDCMLII